MVCRLCFEMEVLDWCVGDGPRTRLRVTGCLPQSNGCWVTELHARVGGCLGIDVGEVGHNIQASFRRVHAPIF